jgi:desulfoferrodoxin (superoxide reductase-like protein)
MGWKHIMLPLLALLLLAMSGVAYADVPDVHVTAPDSAKAGESVPIVVGVTHEDVAPGHYVDIVRLYDGDALLKEWRYGPGNYVKGEKWTVSYDGAFDRDARLRAVAHCTLHGNGAGEGTIRVY